MFFSGSLNLHQARCKLHFVCMQMFRKQHPQKCIMVRWCVCLNDCRKFSNLNCYKSVKGDNIVKFLSPPFYKYNEIGKNFYIYFYRLYSDFILLFYTALTSSAKLKLCIFIFIFISIYKDL